MRVLLTLLSSYNVLFLQVLVFCSSEGTGDCVVLCADSIFSEPRNLLCACRELSSRTLSVLSCCTVTYSQQLLEDVLYILSTVLPHHLPKPRDPQEPTARVTAASTTFLSSWSPKVSSPQGTALGLHLKVRVVCSGSSPRPPQCLSMRRKVELSPEVQLMCCQVPGKSKLFFSEKLTFVCQYTHTS